MQLRGAPHSYFSVNNHRHTIHNPPFRQPHPFVRQKKKEDHQKWTTSLVNNSAKMRDMCKI
ncbi:hypothetical protein HZ326_31788, partial [Fusarium oxysporum f. sp. albedinis]